MDIDTVEKKYKEINKYLGYEGVEFINCRRAFMLFSELAEEGFAYAQAATGIMLLKGIGVDKNEEEGMKYLNEAKKNGAPPPEELMQKLGCVPEINWELFADLLLNNGQVARGLGIKKVIGYGLNPYTGIKRE